MGSLGSPLVAQAIGYPGILPGNQLDHWPGELLGELWVALYALCALLEGALRWALLWGLPLAWGGMVARDTQPADLKDRRRPARFYPPA